MAPKSSLTDVQAGIRDGSKVPKSHPLLAHGPKPLSKPYHTSRIRTTDMALLTVCK